MGSEQLSIAIIPARGGSKGVPGKNLRRVLGLPLLAYAINAAREARSIAATYVSTDAQDIAEVAEAFGATVIQRPPELSTDDATSESALLHAIDVLEVQGLPNHFAFLQCTAPLMTGADIDSTLELLIDKDADCAFAAAPSHRFLWRLAKGGTAEPHGHDARVRPRRQDLRQHVEAGSVYALRTESFRRVKQRFCGTTVAFEIPAWRCIEVDTEEDLLVARTLLQHARLSVPRERLPVTTECLVLDFDGVLTDNRVIVNSEGEESISFNRSDGLGIDELLADEVRVLVISSETHPVVAARCRKLGIPFEQGARNKAATLTAWLERERISIDRTVYVGNDVNDIGCMTVAGCGVAVADAHPHVLQVADLVLSMAGGRGAVREVTELIRTRNRAST